MISWYHYTTLTALINRPNLLNCVQGVDDFFKLLSLDLNAVAVHNHPPGGGVFLGQLPQLVFTDTEIFRRFFYGESVLLSNRHISNIQNCCPLSTVETISYSQRFNGLFIGRLLAAAPREFHPVPCLWVRRTML